jgi:hypothetical protein
MIKDGEDLLRRLCNDQDADDGLLRLVPGEGKQLIEFERAKGVEGGVDLKVVNWGVGCQSLGSATHARPLLGICAVRIRHLLNLDFNRRWGR